MFIVVVVIVGLAAVGGLLLFPDVGLQKQAAAAQGLLGVAMTLFAILGVWIAVLDPTRHLDRNPDEQLSEKECLSQDLLRPWIAATIVFALAMILNFALNILPIDPDNPLFLRVSGFFVSLLFLLTLYVLIGTMLPVARLAYKRRERELRQSYRSKKT